MDRTIRFSPEAVEILKKKQAEIEAELGIPVTIAKVVNILVIKGGKSE